MNKIDPLGLNEKKLSNIVSNPVPIDPYTTKGAWAYVAIGVGNYIDNRQKENAGTGFAIGGFFDFPGSILSGLFTLYNARENGQQTCGVSPALLDKNATSTDKVIDFLIR